MQYCCVCHKKVLSPFFKKITYKNINAWQAIIGDCATLKWQDKLCSLHFENKSSTTPNVGFNGGYWAILPSPSPRQQRSTQHEQKRQKQTLVVQQDNYITPLLDIETFAQHTQQQKEKDNLLQQQQQTLSTTIAQLNKVLAKNNALQTTNTALHSLNNTLHSQYKGLQLQLTQLQLQLQKQHQQPVIQELRVMFSLSLLKDSAKSIRQWTAFENYVQFKAFYATLNTTNGINCI
jgi:hypothetical protein